MNILNYKYKAHKLVNIVFYLIIFLIGFLMGLGIKKINISKILSNILFIEKVEAYNFYTKGDVKIDEEFIYNNFKNSFADFDINTYSNIACDYSPNTNDEKRLSCYAFSYNQLVSCEWIFDVFGGKRAVCRFPISKVDNYYFQYSIDRNKNVDVVKNYNFRLNNNGLGYSMEFTLYSSGMSSKSYGNFYIPSVNNEVWTETDIKNWKKLDFSKYMYSRKPNNIKNFGKNNYGFFVNEVTFSSNNGKRVICPKNRPFDNDYCYYKYADFNSDIDLSNTTFLTYVNVSEKKHTISANVNKYYILTYRLKTKYKFIPSSIHFLGETSEDKNVTSYKMEIVKTNLRDVGNFTDYQIVLKMPENFEKLNIDKIAIKYQDLDEKIDKFDDTFSYGFYNAYKLTEFDHEPTQTEIDNNYYNNDLDTIKNKKDSIFDGINSDSHGVTSIVKAPLNAIRKISSGTCKPVSIKLKGTVFKLPCGDEAFWNKSEVSSFKVVWEIIASGVICYGIGANIVKIINRIKDPHNDKLEVIDL